VAYSEKQISEIFNKACLRIQKGESIRNILKDEDMPASETFFRWVAEKENKSKQYARALLVRADMMFEEMIEIADKQSEDVIETNVGTIVNHNIINRNKLQVDTRKWALSKLNPKKYGDKVDHDIKHSGNIVITGMEIK